MQKELHLFPNPTTGKLFIQSSFVIIQADICDLQGSVVLSESSGVKEIQLDISMLNPGIYFLKLKTVNGIILKKVVIQ